MHMSPCSGISPCILTSVHTVGVLSCLVLLFFASNLSSQPQRYMARFSYTYTFSTPSQIGLLIQLVLSALSAGSIVRRETAKTTSRFGMRTSPSAVVRESVARHNAPCLSSSSGAPLALLPHIIMLFLLASNLTTAADFPLHVAGFRLGRCLRTLVERPWVEPSCWHAESGDEVVGLR